VRRRLLPLLALVAVALGVPAAAHAVTEPDATTVRAEGTFSGLAYGTTATGSIQYEPTPYGPFDVTVDFSCEAGRCVVLTVNEGGSGGLEDLELVDGAGSWSTPVSCGEDEIVDARASSGTAVLDGAVLTVEERFDELVEGDCPPALGVGANENTWVLEFAAADVCVIDGACVEEESVAGSTDDEDCCAPPGSARPFAEPTVYSGLDTVAAAATPGNLLWAALGTVVLALLVAIPTHFFNSAAETLSDRVGAWWRRMRKRPDAGEAKRGGWPLAAGGVAVAAVIAAFADPGFGFDAAGLRVLLSILAAFAVEVVLGWVAVILLVRRTHPTASASFRFAPLTLLVVAAAVLLTRLTGFEPPIVFGLVAGVAFGGLLGTAEKARVTLIGLGWAFGVGVLAWIGYSLLVAAGVDGAGGVFARELLSAAAIAGLSALPIALLPLRGLAGRTVWEASRRVWIAAYAIGLFAFLLVLLPLPASWTEVGFGLWAWVGLYLLYALAALGIWLVVTRPWQREPSDAAA
jgi:hypothetical protein